MNNLHATKDFPFETFDILLHEDTSYRQLSTNHIYQRPIKDVRTW